MKLNKGLIAAADSETYEPSLIAGQKQIIDSAGLVANQRELSDGTLGTDIKSAKLANQVSIAESDTFLAIKDLNAEALDRSSLK